MTTGRIARKQRDFVAISAWGRQELRNMTKPLKRIVAKPVVLLDNKTMRIFIAGIDGYIGWPLAMYLANRGHEVGGTDLFFRREWVEEVGSWSATPIRPMRERLEAFGEVFAKKIDFY